MIDRALELWHQVWPVDVSNVAGSRSNSATPIIDIQEPELGAFELSMDGFPQLLFTDNDTNTKALFDWDGTPGVPGFGKDAFHRRVIHGEEGAVNPLEQ